MYVWLFIGCRTFMSCIGHWNYWTWNPIVHILDAMPDIDHDTDHSLTYSPSITGVEQHSTCRNLAHHHANAMSSTICRQCQLWTHKVLFVNYFCPRTLKLWFCTIYLTNGIALKPVLIGMRKFSNSLRTFLSLCFSMLYVMQYKIDTGLQKCVSFLLFLIWNALQMTTDMFHLS